MATLCGSQTRAPERASVRRRTLAAPNDLEICFSNHSGLSFTESGFLSQSLPTSAATSLDHFRLTSPCRADHFDGGFTARVTVAGGLDRAAVGLLQGISIRGRVFLRELDSTDSDLKQLGGCLVIRTAAQRFFRFPTCRCNSRPRSARKLPSSRVRRSHSASGTLACGDAGTRPAARRTSLSKSATACRTSVDSTFLAGAFASGGCATPSARGEPSTEALVAC